VPRDNAEFEAGETLRIYLQPFGFGFVLTGDGFRSALAADIEIRTPSGLILAEAADFGLLSWSGREMMREVHATIAVPLPDLKPGTYELGIELRDQGSSKTASISLPFTIIEPAADSPLKTCESGTDVRCNGGRTKI
jgi:hypothetical protein